MAPQPLTVYLDESGFTGNNLLDEAQPIFIVSAVAISVEEATKLVAEVSKEFSLTAKEIKGSKLCGFARGRQAILKLLELLKGRYRFIAMNKRYAAACKVFEYLVEPTISDCSWFFYQKRFHYFVADAVYYQTKSDYKEILTGLATAIRERNPEKMYEALDGNTGPAGKVTVLDLLKELAVNNRELIVDEFKTLQGLDQARWVMDLSSTALFSLLCTWAEEGRPLDVHCDESKPLASAAPSFSARIGAKSEVIEMPFGDKRRLFSLEKEIALERSDAVPGLQLADAVASAAAAVLNNPKSDFGKKAGALLDDYMDPSSMFPSSRSFTEEERGRLADLLVLMAKSRSQGMSPCAKLDDIISKAKRIAGLT